MSYADLSEVTDQDKRDAYDRNDTNDTVSTADLTQESTLDLMADEKTPEENVRIIRCMLCVL